MKKTLSLIDLSKVEEIDTQAGEIGRYLSENLNQRYVYEGIGSSFHQAQRFGYDPKTDAEVAVDLSDLSRYIGKQIPEGAVYAERLNAAIDNAFLYQRQDGSRPDAYGISTISPRNRKAEETISIEKIVPVTKDWSYFLVAYVTHVGSDMNRPVIIPLSGGKYLITDDQGIQRVSVNTDWMPEVTNFSHSYRLKTDPVYHDADGVYFPNPDDLTFYLQDVNTGERALFYHTYLGNDASGNEYYFGYADITRGAKTREAALNIIRNTSGGISYSFIPFKKNPDTGEQIFSRVPLEVREGDIITPWIVERFFDEESRWQYTPYIPLNLRGDLSIVRDRLPHGAYLSSMFAHDYNMNYA